MQFFKNILQNEELRMQLACIVISGAALLANMLDICPLPFDLAWLAVILCGVPIVWGALKGLVTEFDIKADVLVSIALIASLTIGEDFAAGEIAFIMQLGSLLEEATVARARAGIENWCAFPRVLRAGLLTARKKLSVRKMYGKTIFCVCCRAKPFPLTVLLQLAKLQ